MPSSFANDANHWRARADEARKLADDMNDPQSKEMMLGIAKDYDSLAERTGRTAST